MKAAIVPEGALDDGADRLVVAASHGSVAIEPARSFVTEGEYVLAGDVVAHLRDGATTVPVRSTADAWLIAYLVGADERVEPGTPIVHLRLV